VGLGETFELLPSPRSAEGLPSFATAVVPGGLHRLGKDAQGAAALLLVTEEGASASGSVPLELEHLVIQHAVPCLIWKENGTSEESAFTLIRCRDADRVLTAYFLGVVETILPLLGSAPSQARIREAVSHLVELFRALQTPSRKTVQGLWAELFLIAQAASPVELVRAWHQEPEESVDFNVHTQRLEVKSAVGPERRHYFSLEQLIAPAGVRVLVASLFVQRAGGGVSVADLLSRVRGRLEGDVDLMLKVEQVVVDSLGQDWRLGLEESFDIDRAEESLAFYRGGEIPCVEPRLPAEVSEVRFKADLCRLERARTIDLQLEGGIFRAAVPARPSGF
jgi:hypothetical protein